MQQDGMSVAEYEGKFHALARDASMILPTEAERVRRFFKGLNIPIRLEFLRLLLLVFHSIRW